MKKKPEQRPYYRTAALLGAQQQPYGGLRMPARSRASGAGVRQPELHLDIPWKFIAMFALIGAVVAEFVAGTGGTGSTGPGNETRRGNTGRWSCCPCCGRNGGLR